MKIITPGTEIALGTNLNAKELEIIDEFAETFNDYILMQSGLATYLLNHATCNSKTADRMSAWLENHNLEYLFQ